MLVLEGVLCCGKLITSIVLLFKQAVDAVYFNGGSKDGCYFVGATARRHDNLIQTLLYIRVIIDL